MKKHQRFVLRYGIKESILNIRENLYEGKDYLPHLIREWSGTFPKK